MCNNEKCSIYVVYIANKSIKRRMEFILGKVSRYFFIYLTRYLVKRPAFNYTDAQLEQK